MNGRWKIFVDKQPWNGSQRLFMVVAGPMGARSYVGPLTLKTHDPGAAVPFDDATLSETMENREDGVGDVTGFLQAALDAAWEHGLRPTGFADHTNELAAVRYHLEDMRELTGKLNPRK